MADWRRRAIGTCPVLSNLFCPVGFAARRLLVGNSDPHDNQPACQRKRTPSESGERPRDLECQATNSGQRDAHHRKNLAPRTQRSEQGREPLVRTLGLESNLGYLGRAGAMFSLRFRDLMARRTSWKSALHTRAASSGV